MIEGKASITYKGKALEAYVQIQEGSLGVELIIPVISSESFECAEEIYATIIKQIAFFDKDNNLYSIENVLFFTRVFNLKENRLIGRFETFLRGVSLYGRGFIQIHFIGMEEIFLDLNEINKRKIDSSKWVFQKNGDRIIIRHDLRIIKNLNELRKIINRVIDYWGFTLGVEVFLDYMIFETEEGENVGRIIYDSDINYMVPKMIRVEDRYKQPYNKIEQELNKWLTIYPTYHEVIDIWRKTLHCKGVTEEDIFIWRCQSFELLCSLNVELRKSANEKMAPEQKYPNICNYLAAANERLTFLNCDVSYFQSVKKARDIYTHYNIKKDIGESEWKNANNIIRKALYRTMEELFSVSRIIRNDFFFLMFPNEEGRGRRKIMESDLFK